MKMFPSDLLVMSFIWSDLFSFTWSHTIPQAIYIADAHVGREETIQPLIKSHFMHLGEIQMYVRKKKITETGFLANIFQVVKLTASPNLSVSSQANVKSKERLCVGIVIQFSLAPALFSGPWLWIFLPGNTWTHPRTLGLLKVSPLCYSPLWRKEVQRGQPYWCVPLWP